MHTRGRSIRYDRAPDCWAAKQAFCAWGGAGGQLVLPRRGLLVTATWAKDRRAVERALGGRPLQAVPSRPAAARARVAAVARHAKASSSGVFTGLGFDACSAPSTSAMSAWG